MWHPVNKHPSSGSACMRWHHPCSPLPSRSKNGYYILWTQDYGKIKSMTLTSTQYRSFSSQWSTHLLAPSWSLDLISQNQLLNEDSFHPYILWVKILRFSCSAVLYPLYLFEKTGINEDIFNHSPRSITELCQGWANLTYEGLTILYCNQLDACYSWISCSHCNLGWKRLKILIFFFNWFKLLGLVLRWWWNQMIAISELKWRTRKKLTGVCHTKMKNGLNKFVEYDPEIPLRGKPNCKL